MLKKIVPKCYDLFCGLGGFSEGFLAEGYECIGFDIEAHDYGIGGYPGTLILRDVRSIHGSELADATVIVASPPCQAYSYWAMPWKKAKALGPPDNTLFNECFRIQREAIAAAGHHIPMIVENVRGAQKWVGRAQYHYGSFYLWGDVPALMPMTAPKTVKCGHLERSYRNGHVSTAHLTNPGEYKVPASVAATGTKQGGDWWDAECRKTSSAQYGSKSSKRKAASAMIAKIPEPLSRWIAQAYKPVY
jgi:site-specific DNA-cytosine methylase